MKIWVSIKNQKQEWWLFFPSSLHFWLQNDFLKGFEGIQNMESITVSSVSSFFNCLISLLLSSTEETKEKSKKTSKWDEKGSKKNVDN